jgi:hyperosmotically inducible periplasmic protein
MSSKLGTAALAALFLLCATGCSLFRAHEAATSAYVGDNAITARVQTALIKDPHIQANEIEVQTNQARVTLNGVVDSTAMLQRALDIARATPGVRTIDDKLTVASDKPLASVRQPGAN